MTQAKFKKFKNFNLNSESFYSFFHNLIILFYWIYISIYNDNYSLNLKQYNKLNLKIKSKFNKNNFFQ